MPTIKSKLLAVNDTAFTTEDAVVNIAVLANDLPAGTPKTLYSLAQSGTAVVTKATTKLGATITMNPNGTVNYDPTGDAAIQALAQGETATDTFIYTMKEANTLFTASVSVTLTGVNDPPVISGTKANQATTDTVPISPFSGVAITDVDHNAQDSLIITFNGANGTLSGAGLSGSNGVYTLSAASPTVLTSELDQLVFTPTAHQGAAGTTITTNFTLATTDDKSATTSNSATSVVATESAAATTIVGYQVTLTDVPNATSTNAIDINDNGEVVGTYFIQTSSTSVLQDGYTYVNGRVTTIDRPGAVDTHLSSVNNEGDLTGAWDFGSPTLNTGFVEHNGFFSDFSIPNSSLIVRGMNNSQVVVGTETPNSLANQGGFTYDNVTGNVTLIQHGADVTAAFAINDSGVVVGSYFNGIDHGFLYQNGSFTPFNISDPSGVLDTEITAINNNGDFAGTYHEGGTTHGFLHTGDISGGVTTLLDMSDVSDLNNNDVVVGISSQGDAAVYTDGKVLQLSINGGTGGGVLGINSNNVIAGALFDSSGHVHGFFGTPVTG